MTKKKKTRKKSKPFNFYGIYPVIEGAQRDRSTLVSRGYEVKIRKRRGFYRLYYRHPKGSHPKVNSRGVL